MNFIKAAVSVFLLLMAEDAFCQKEMNNWFFGYNAGITFESGAAANRVGGSIYNFEGCSAISDDAGNLLFYTDGMRVWDRRHQLMPNGMDLKGDTIATQSSLIVRVPGNKDRFYLFCVGSIEKNNPILTYSEIDINLNGGYGDVVTDNKNKLLSNFVCEKITAIKHENANDLWIVSHAFNSDEFLVYYINCRGINETPIIQKTGQLVNGQEGNAIGYMKGSTDGKKLAVAHFRGTVELFDFDNRTGTLSHSRTIGSNPGSVCQGYGIEFSPDSELMYVSYLYNCGAVGGYEISQFRANAADINATKYIVASGLGDPPGALQIGTDSRIYVSFAFTSTLGCINSPNVYGAGCQFNQQQVALSAKTGIGLPNTTSGFLRTLLGRDTSFCSPFSYELHLNTATTYLWDDGSQGSSRQIKQTGKYWARIETAEGCLYSDTLVVDSKPQPYVYVGEDTAVCTPDIQFELTATTDYQVVWQDGSMGTNYTVTSPGTYWAEVIENGCSGRDSLNVVLYKATPFTLGNDTSMCQGIHNLSAGDGYTQYMWSTGESTQSIAVQETGAYWAEAINTYGCTYSDTVKITFNPAPEVHLGRDTSLCEGSSYVLDVSNAGSSFLWQNKSTESSFLVQQPGVYFVQVENDGCKAADTLTVSYQAFPHVELGDNLEICPGKALEIDAGSRADWFKWSTGSNSRVINVTNPGTYRVEAGNACGSVVDEVVISKGSCKIRLPNAFTPGKPTNNRFGIANGFGIADYLLRVYNRWGQLIFESKDPLSGWTGRRDGILQEAGTYIFTVTYLDPETKTKHTSKGTFLLIR